MLARAPDPPEPEPESPRARRADALCQHYYTSWAFEDRMADIEPETQKWDKADLESTIADILADLRHLAKARSVNFDDVVALSEIHFECELDDNEQTSG